MESTKELLKRAIECALDYVENKNYLPTTKQVAEALGVSDDKAEQIMQDSEYIKLKNLRDGYTSFDSERKKGFGGFKVFYKWYITQEPKCHYCGTTESNLKKLFKINDDDKKKPLYSKKISFTATLQVDRKNPDEGYNEQNCVLACAFCNNAKSDMVRECDLDCFEKPFGEFVKNFYADLDKKYKLGLND